MLKPKWRVDVAIVQGRPLSHAEVRASIAMCGEVRVMMACTNTRIVNVCDACSLGWSASAIAAGIAVCNAWALGSSKRVIGESIAVYAMHGHLDTLERACGIGMAAYAMHGRLARA